jgi:hypothetical protein
VIGAWLRMIPEARRPRRIYAMIVCHLDDSGEDRDPVVTLAGYLTTATEWAKFEPRADEYFAASGVEYLTTKELYHRKGQFKDWSSAETLKFATGLFEILGEHCSLGVEFSVFKEPFNRRKLELGMKREGGPFTFCLKGLLNNLMKDEVMQKCLALDGVDLSFVIESGTRSGPLVGAFNVLKDAGAYEGMLGSCVLEDKKKLKALQVSDFLAFFSRRLRCTPKSDPRIDLDADFFNTATKAIKTQSYFLATDFYREEPA